MASQSRSDARPGLERPELPPPPGAEARELGRSLGISVTVAEVLHRRGYRDLDELRRFLEPRLAQLTPPGQMADRAAAAERLATAVRRRERVCIFGDYDCDGITSAVIMAQVLRALGGEAVVLLASRFDGGYGVSAAATSRIVDSGAGLLVTCDCGSSDHESLTRIREQKLDAIVIDHHVVPEEPLPVVAFLNPHRPDCGFAYKDLASCGLVLSLAAALRAALGQDVDLREWLDLVAIGTVADVVPLDRDNRVLVRAGLKRLAQARRPGVRALFELAKLEVGTPLTGEDVAFRLAPRLNTPGRLGSPDPALELLLAQSSEAARGIAAEIEQLSLQRKAQQEQTLGEAVEEIEREGYAEREGIVVGRPGWNHGIVGIVAARLMERYGRPVAVVGFDQQGRGRGSVRGPAGSQLYDALAAASGVLERFGGHQAAAGLEVRLERLAELRARFEQACAREGASAGSVDPHRPQGLTLLSQEDDLAQVVRDLERLEPCGNSNPRPRLVVEAEVRSARQVRGGHLKLDLALPSGQRLGAFGVSMGVLADEVAGAIMAVGTLRRDTWRGGDAVELKLEQILR